MVILCLYYKNAGFVLFSLNVLLVGEEYGRLQMYAYGIVHISTIELSQLGIDNVSFIPSMLSLYLLLIACVL